MHGLSTDSMCNTNACKQARRRPQQAMQRSMRADLHLYAGLVFTTQTPTAPGLALSRQGHLRQHGGKMRPVVFGDSLAPDPTNTCDVLHVTI